MNPGGRSRPGRTGHRRRLRAPISGAGAVALRPTRPAFPVVDGSSRRRLIAMLVVLVVAFALVAGRLVDVQGFSAGPYAALGLSQRVHTVTLPADRGSILDRNGNTLAMSVPQSTVWADPSLVTAPAQEAAALSPVLGLDAPTITARLIRPGRFSYVARMVDDTTAAAVKNLRLPGVFLVDEPKRFEPDGPLAAPVIGSVGVDDQGLSGLELAYDPQLAGRPGRLVSEDDPSGRPIPGGVSRLTPATKGSDLVLTLDRSLQYEVEQDLSHEILTARAKGGMAIVMDRKTGEILALANLTVGSDGTTVAPASSNQAVTTVYEPGSVEKLITLSAALNQGVVHPTDVFTLPDRIHVSDSWFSDDTPHPVEQWTPTDILTASSNVGAITLGEKVGKRPLDSYIRRFGLGSKTGLNLPYESAGLLLNPSKWSGTTLATVAFGQGMAVTAMQLVAAYNTIANGGVYVAPKLVKATVDGGGRVVNTPPSATHRVVSPTVAREVTAMLTEVVRGGTGTAAAISDYQVAGKTGTARKSFEGQQGYATASYVSSFAGFVPASDPSFTAMVVLDQPTPIFGGLVAAPVFHDIATYALRQLGVPPPPADPGLFVGVPHAQPSSATAADEPGKPGRAAGPFVSSSSNLLDPPPPAVPTPTTSTTTTPTTSTTVGPGAGPPGGANPPGAHPPGAAPPPPTARGAPPTTSLLSPVAVATTTTTGPPPPPTTSTTRPKGPGSVVPPSGSPSSVPATR